MVLIVDTYTHIRFCFFNHSQHDLHIDIVQSGRRTESDSLFQGEERGFLVVFVCGYRQRACNVPHRTAFTFCGFCVGISNGHVTYPIAQPSPSVVCVCGYRQRACNVPHRTAFSFCVFFVHSHDANEGSACVGSNISLYLISIPSKQKMLCSEKKLAVEVPRTQKLKTDHPPPPPPPPWPCPAGNPGLP